MRFSIANRTVRVSISIDQQTSRIWRVQHYPLEVLTRSYVRLSFYLEASTLPGAPPPGYPEAVRDPISQFFSERGHENR